LYVKRGGNACHFFYRPFGRASFHKWSGAPISDSRVAGGALADFFAVVLRPLERLKKVKNDSRNYF
jgi:hypothetical protein